MRVFVCFVFLFIFHISFACKVTNDCDYGEICTNDECGDCTSDSDCSNEQNCNDGSCEHKSIDPVDFYDFLLFFVIIIGSALNASVGIGGGTLYMPLLLLLFFQDQEAVTLSNGMTTCAALGQVVLNWFSKHPASNSQLSRPLIDFDVALIVSPLSTAGTIIGSYVYSVLPVIVVRYLLILFLMGLNYRIFKKTRSEWASHKNLKEKELKETHKIENDDNDEHHETGKLLTEKGSSENVENSLNHSNENKESQIIHIRSVQHDEESYGTFVDENSNEVIEQKFETTDTKEINQQQTSDINDKLREMLIQDSRIPLKKISVIIVFFSIISVFSFTLKQSDWWTGGVEFCGVGYWFVVLCLFPFISLVTYLIALYFDRRYQLRLKNNYPIWEGDIVWTKKKVVIVSLFSLVAGCTASMFGIGGGVLYVPMMMELGMRPEVYSATSGFLIVLTSLSSFLTHVFSGHVLVDYVIICSILAFVSAFVGVKKIKTYLKKSGKTYVVFIILNVALTMSALALFIYTVVDMDESLKKGSNPFSNFGTVC